MAASTSVSTTRLTLLDATMIIVGSMIGSGIFIAPSLIAGLIVQAQLGAGAFVSIWLVGGLLTLCGALCYGELAAALPRAGGQYVFLKEAFTPLWGFLYGWTLFTVIQSGFIAAVAIAFANYAGVFFPRIGQSEAWFRAGSFSLSGVQVFAVFLIVSLSGINARGLREGSFVQNLFGVGKTAALLALITAGMLSHQGNWAHFQPLLPRSLSPGVLAAFGVAMSKALFAYDSWNIVTFVAEETQNSTRTLPRALFLGTLSVSLIYSLAATAYLRILSVAQASAAPDQRIAAQVAQLVLGPAGANLVALGILISTAGCVNGLILAGPRLYSAMAQDNLFFSGAARIHPQRGTPVHSIRYQAIWAIFLVFSGSFGSRGAQLYSDLLTFTSFASLLFNALTVAGLLVLRKKQPALPRPYRVAGYPWIPLLYLSAAVFFLIFIAAGDPRNSAFGVAIIASGAPLYLYWKTRQGRKTDVPPEPPAPSQLGGTTELIN
jgi:APA family basic amino acid/polyamine antiporter